ncbi:conserved exported hypothetical protein [Carnobacterium maltaromaticum]|uniref:DUF916 and DUF3324 domain-containing protein n=1 Tax=Carnobacterium maltaromaticum TaxID=2751 RepID=A0AAW9JVD3_CARML|nr:DUF916 and DUF3324 domain-containing protein [Carnobacterium maltaromaticum]MDZ5759563.1 DUF916 and DUF3324 domain-containing protein [Carnobacterium maltaromaticum]CAD5897490.1 conserved exported hypothetical protein [Carnobacterium maltaromaticum]
MRLKIGLLGFFIASLFLFLGWTNQIEASGSEYTVRAILAKNQNPTISSYFDVTVTLGDEQIFTIVIENNTTEEKEYKIEPGTAVTNSNGVIEYSKKNSKKDTTLINNFEDLISDAQTVKLAANEKKQVDFVFEVPNEKFDGILLGGFVVTPIEKKNSNQPIINVYTHTIAAVIRESSAPVEPELKLNKIKVGQINYHNVIQSEIQNKKPMIMSKLKIESVITKKGESKVLYEESKENFKMAPNSTLNYPISIKEKFTAGDYTVHINASNQDENWKFTKNFTINEEKKQELNAKTIDSDNHYNYVYMILALAAFILLVIGIIVYMKKKEKGHSERRR